MRTLSINQVLTELELTKDKNGNYSSAKLLKNKSLTHSLMEYTAFLPENATYRERIYCIQNNIKERKRCSRSGEYLKWNANLKDYGRSRKEAIKNRNNKNYKKCVKNVVVSIFKTLQEKYKSGDYKLINKKECLALKPDTNSTHYMIRKNYDLYCSLIYHTKFLGENIDIKWAERFYCLKHNISQIPTNCYGEELSFVDYNKGYQKYGSRKVRQKIEINNIREFITSNNFEVLEEIEDLSKNKHIKVRCNKCGEVEEKFIKNGYHKNMICNKCEGVTPNKSKKEKELVSFLRSFVCSEEIVENYKYRNIGDKYYREIDIFVKNLNIGIEFNGIIWHSFGSCYPNNTEKEKDKKYHLLEKRDELYKMGIKTLNIFETEWDYKKEVVKSLVLNKLGLTENKIYARKCEIDTPSKDEKSKFYAENHIQGNCQSNFDVGLRYNDEYVCMMSFSDRKMGKNKNKEIELARYAVKKYMSVVGGFSKLLKHSKNILKRDMISYCDKRFSFGEVYMKNGFELVRETPPNYFYIGNNCRILESRVKYQKHKLQKYFEDVDMNKTEKEIMYENKYRRLYDCGNYVFLLRS